jgi:hypothetical protein
MRQRRYLAFCTAVLIATGALASTASAERPTRDFVPAGTLSYPAGKACSFGLLIEVVINREYALTFPADANGDVRVIVTGRLVARYTNVENGHSLELNIGGPVFYTFHPDGSFDAVLAGRSAINLYPTDIPPGPIALLNSGQLVITLTAESQLILHDQVGHSASICAMLT